MTGATRTGRPELGNLLPRDAPRSSLPLDSPSASMAQLRHEAPGSQRNSHGRAAGATTALGCSTILAIRKGMPRDEIQGLFFLLGLLLAFYFLTPFLELSRR